MILAIIRDKQRLDSVFSMVELMPLDPEVLSHWAKYLCVLTSGFIENSLRVILQDYAEKHANNDVASFVSTRIDGLTNLNDEKIGQLLGAFSPTWRDTFNATRSTEQKDAIDSVLANRNLIAHGRSVGLTLARMKQYYGDISKVVKIIDEECVNK
jgi:hypothetical protein